jgi:hypothetical protein
MNYEGFRQQIEEQHGDFFTTMVTTFFKKAVEFAINKQYEEALKVGNDALAMAQYSNIDYEIVYLIGMLCEAYLDNDQPEIANEFFEFGVKILDENDSSYDRDVDQFLDLKIIIEEELEKKNKSLQNGSVTVLCNLGFPHELN